MLDFTFHLCMCVKAVVYIHNKLYIYNYVINSQFINRYRTCGLANCNSYLCNLHAS